MVKLKKFVLTSSAVILVILTVWNVFYIDYLYKKLMSRVSRSSLIEYQKIDQMFPERLPEAWQQDLISTYLYDNRPATHTNHESKNKRRNDRNSIAVPSKDEHQNKGRNYQNTTLAPSKDEHQNKGRNYQNTTLAPSKDKHQNKGRNARSFFANLASPSYQDYRAMIVDDHSLNQRIFPREDICQYYGLRKPITGHDKVKGNHHPLPTCRPMVKTEEDCKEIIGYYGKPGEIVSTKCEENTYEPVCIIKRYNPNERKEANKLHVTCNIKQCQMNTMFVGFFNDDTGLIGEKDWIKVTNNRQLRQNILRHMHKSQFGSGYALIKCKKLRNDKDIIHLLFLPRIMPVKVRKTSRSKKQININIILEDSLSRNHFFRSLPKSKATLSKILHSSSSKATVLDFEMMQGFSSYTWNNLIRLFSAGKNDKETDGQEVLYKMFKSAGYATFYQEDSCWYDRWGTMLFKDMVTHVKRGRKEMLKKWIKHKEALKKKNFTNFIDDFGLTYHTCTAFKEMNISNMYREPTTCYNGEYFASMYFRYVRNYIDILQSLSSTTPFFAYTHVLTSHENSGKRITSDDEQLSELFNHAAQQHNTLTILLSDHGAKLTPFAIKTNQGRYEVFQPLMFMIVPDNVAKVLGKNVMDALVVNQKRLVTSEDLHFALRSLVENVENKKKISNGLFAPISLKRTCDDIQFYDKEALCRCDGWIKAVSSTSVSTQWAAEVALGYINNKIQNERMNTTKQSSHETSSRRCQRYSGKRVEHARASTTTTHRVISFSLVVKPLFMDVEEIFEIDVTHPVGISGGSRVTNLVRVTRYDKYFHCIEPTVHYSICTCKANATLRHNDVILKAQNESGFTRKSEMKMLDEPCLGLIKRSRQRLILNTTWQDALVTYEAFNNCSHLVYKLLVESEKLFTARLSTSTPFSVELLPNTLTHLVTASIVWKSGFFIPRITFKRTKV